MASSNQTSASEVDIVGTTFTSISSDDSRPGSVQTVSQDKDTTDTEQFNVKRVSDDDETGVKPCSKQLIRRKSHGGSKHSEKLCKESADEQSQDASMKTVEDGDDSTPVTTQHVMLGETAVNTSILDEILNDKKRCLLESPEIVEFIRSRMQPS